LGESEIIIAGVNADHVAGSPDYGNDSPLYGAMVIVRILDGIVRNKYANDPGKLAAWLSASHVEKKKETPKP